MVKQPNNNPSSFTNLKNEKSKQQTKQDTISDIFESELTLISLFSEPERLERFQKFAPLFAVNSQNKISIQLFLKDSKKNSEFARLITFTFILK